MFGLWTYSSLVLTSRLSARIGPVAAFWAGGWWNVVNGNGKGERTSQPASQPARIMEALAEVAEVSK